MKKFFYLFAACGMLAGSSGAQIVTSVNPDTYVDIHNLGYACSTDVSAAALHTVNCDMHDINGNKFYAVAFTATDVGTKDVWGMWGYCFTYNPAPMLASGVRVEYTGPNSFTWPKDFALPGAAHPDIVIGNDYTSSNAGDFFLGVVYLNASGEVEIANCPVTNIGNASPPNAQLGIVSSGVVVSTPGRIVTSKPHIDMFADANCSRWGGKILRKYFATWSEYDPGSNTHYIMGAFGNLNNTPLTPTVVTVTTQGIHPDVGCMEWIVPGPDDAAYIAYIDPTNNDLMMAEVQLYGFGMGGGMKPWQPTPYVIDYGTSYATIDPPRIEAKAFGNVISGEATWQIVAAVDPGTGFKEIHGYNDAAPPTVISLSSADQHFSPAVAGVGADMATSGQTGLIGQTQFSMAYYSTYTNNPPNLWPGILGTPPTSNGDVYSNYVNISGGTCPNTAKNWEVNHYTLFQPGAHAIPDDMAVALSSSSNTGDDLLAVWYQGFEASTFNWGTANHKITSGNSYAFKPMLVRDKHQVREEYEVYPNPAYDKLHVKGVFDASYDIIDVTGRIVSEGKIRNSAQGIDIAKLTPGVYVLNIHIGDETKRQKFVKE